MAEDNQGSETETTMIRRTMTPRELLWIRWFIGVGIPTLVALRAGLKLIFVQSPVTNSWLDAVGDTMIAFGAAMGGFMDRLWGTWKDEKKVPG